MSRPLVLLCVERRKAWRLLQSTAGVEKVEYRAQRALTAKLDAGELTQGDLLGRGAALLENEVTRLQPRPVVAA